MPEILETVQNADPTAAADARHAAFVASMEAKYEAEDRAAMDQADGVDGGADAAVAVDKASSGTSGSSTKKVQAKVQDAGDTNDEATAEHTASDTSASPDGDDVESDVDSAAGDDAEHPPEEKTEGDSDDDAEAETDEKPAEDEGEDETQDDLLDATKLLNSRGAELKLEDVPVEYRPLVEKQIKGARQAFSRVMQEQTAFRADRAKFEAERTYIAEHPELVIVELLQKHPELFEKVNELEGSIGEDAAEAEKFKARVKDTREQVEARVTKELDAAQREFEQKLARADDIVLLARDLSTKAGVPWRYAERAIFDALEAKPVASRDITNEEVAALIAEEAKHLSPLTRKATREASIAKVQARVAARKAAPVNPAKKAPATRVPTPAPKKRKVDFNDEDSRLAAMEESARRIMPGVR